MLIKLLAENGADMLVSGKNGLSPIWYACSANQKEIVKLFLDNGVDVNYGKPVGDNESSMSSYLDWVESANDISVTAGYSLKVSNTLGGESLLHVATKSGHLSMVKLLLEKGAEINVQDESGNTPLHYASANGKKDVVKYLLDKEADVSIVNAKEQLAIDYSNIKGFNEITELILETKGAALPTSITAKTEAPVLDKKRALLDLKDLLDVGVLTQEEFNTEKTKILNG